MPGAAPLACFHPAVQRWFAGAFERPTEAQRLAWPAIARRESTLLLAPTGSGKTLAAFLAALDRLIFAPAPAREARLRVVYVSPLKALGADMERNLRAPLAGIRGAASALGAEAAPVDVWLRTGDTPAAERQRFARSSADVLLTTPESLFLLLTSRAAELFTHVETVIVDEIHAMAATKRGAHLMLTLERLEALRAEAVGPLQRVGLSATQRPLDEVARLLGGGTPTPDGWVPRPVTIVDAGRRRALELRVEQPDDADRSDLAPAPREAPLELGGRRVFGEEGAMAAIHRRLFELIGAHRTTMVFVNSRRLAERLAAALSELGGADFAVAHHGSVSKEQRRVMEERLKAGELRAVVATSSLELGIDMGSVELVVQVAPPLSVASGLQRVGRSGHQAEATSRGLLVPRHRGELLPLAAIGAAMVTSDVEATVYPRNALDVLAQQLVALCVAGPVTVDDAWALVRRAAPWAELPRTAFDGVLDLLTGVYPSDDFSGLRPRLAWDRARDVLTARPGALALVVANAGTIPDRGTFGVWMQGEDGRPSRVGELDEEMVFESRPGEVFLLGASSWRIDEITHDRVWVRPAPGEPGKMPFWRGEGVGRSAELGARVGAAARELVALGPERAAERLRTAHGFDERAASALVAYLAEQREAGGHVPSDKTIVVERFFDDLGDLRLCILSPWGGRVHAAWLLVLQATLEEQAVGQIDGTWSDEGIVLRLPEAVALPDLAPLFPSPERAEELLLERLPTSPLFAARFREAAGRALLLPRRRPGQRSPLWAQRKRASDLLAVARRFPSFPLLLEAHRECLREVFDMPALRRLLGDVQRGAITPVLVDTERPSPFASALLFDFVASLLYDGDAPPAERRARALAIDHERLRELLGEAEWRDLLSGEAIAEIHQELARAPRLVRHADDLHDLLLSRGDRSLEELLTAGEVAASDEAREVLVRHRDALRAALRLVVVRVGGVERLVAAEDAARYRDGLGVVLPDGLPARLLEPSVEPLRYLVGRWARTHGPFQVGELVARWGVGAPLLLAELTSLEAAGRVVRVGAPGTATDQWCDADVLRRIKQRSLAKYRRELEPVDGPTLARFLLHLHGVRALAPGLSDAAPERPRGDRASAARAEALAAALEPLLGVPLSVGVLFESMLPARVDGFRPEDLDLLCARGGLRWIGVEPSGVADARIALWVGAPPPREPAEPSDLGGRILGHLRQRGASFYGELSAELGGFGPALLEALWELVFLGLVSNDSLEPLRGYLASRRGAATREGARGRGRNPRPRGALGGHGPGTEGRFWAVSAPATDPSAARLAEVEGLLRRHGVVTREGLRAEAVSGGFAALYGLLRRLEEAGRVRRGRYVEGLGASQFCQPGVDERLRAFREGEVADTGVLLSAVDPAQPYGAVLPFPAASAPLARAVGAHVVLHDGRLVAWLARGERLLRTFLPDEEPRRRHAAEAIGRALLALVRRGGRRALLLGAIDDGEPPAPLGDVLVEVGFTRGARGYLLRRR